MSISMKTIRYVIALVPHDDRKISVLANLVSGGASWKLRREVPQNKTQLTALVNQYRKV